MLRILNIITISFVTFSLLAGQGSTDSKSIFYQDGDVIHMRLVFQDLYEAEDKKVNLRTIMASIRNQDGTYSETDKPISITSKTSIKVTLLGVNLFRYNLDFSTDEVYVESYGFLDRIFSGLIKAIGKGVAGEDMDVFTNWILAIDELENQIIELDDLIPVKPYLSSIDATEISTYIEETILSQLKIVQDRKDDVQLYMISKQNTNSFLEEYYKEIENRFASISEKAKDLQSINKKIFLGVSKTIPTKESGTIVSLSIVPSPNEAIFKTDSDANVEAVSLEYFVQSKHGLHFHTGVGLSSLSELTLQQLSAGSSDVFQIVEENDASAELVAFLSYPLFNLNDLGTSTFDITLGTSYKDVGEEIYLGGTFRLLKFGSVSIGAVLDTKAIEVDGETTLNSVKSNFNFKEKVGAFLSINITAF